MSEQKKQYAHSPVHLAFAWLKIGQQRVRDYIEECEDYRRDGCRPHYCIHGTDQWVDYDNICWGCEESIWPDDRERLLAEAHGRWAEMERRRDKVLGSIEYTMPQEVKSGLIEWTFEPIEIPRFPNHG